MPGGPPPPILDYRTPAPRSPGLLPGWSISCLLAGVLCWLPTALTSTVAYDRWNHPRSDSAAHNTATLLCFLAGPIFGFGLAILFQQKPHGPQRGVLFLKLSLLPLTIALDLCVLMVICT
jgi:hypothetical protein